MKLWPITFHATIEFDSSGAHQGVEDWWRPYLRHCSAEAIETEISFSAFVSERSACT